MTQEVPVNSRDVYLQASLTRTTNNSIPKEEKPSVINAYKQILADQVVLTAQATKYSIVTELNLYTIAISNLSNYLATLTIPVLWNDPSNSTLLASRNNFDSKFTEVMNKRIALQLVIDSFIGAEDTTPPPKASGLVTTPSFASIILNWNPLGDMTKVSHTEIWRSSTNNRSAAVLVGQAPGFVYVDNIGLSATFYYWVRFVSTAAIKGEFNTADVSGTIGTTGQDAQYIMQLLLNKLGYDQFNVASGVFPVRTETTLPTLPNTKYPPGVLVTLTTDGKIYRNVSNVWKADVSASDLTGQVSGSQIANSSLDIAKFASGIEPVGVVSSLPNPVGYTGPKVVILTTTGKMYRYSSNTWSAAVPSTDITGIIPIAQIPNITVDKISGQLTDSQIASVNASKLQGTIVSTQIGANAITTGKVAANAITANEIAAGSILSDKIAANAITAGKVAANAITANEIAAGSILSDKIAANAITAGKVAANAITATEIAAGSITATKIATSAISADKIVANTITAAQIATDTITSGQIAAGAITASEIAAGAITTDKLVVVSRGSAINADPSFIDQTAWPIFSNVSLVTIIDGKSGNKALRSSTTGQISTAASLPFPIIAGKSYRVSVLLRALGEPNTASIRLYRINGAGVDISGVAGMENVTVPLNTWTEFSGVVTAESTAVLARLYVYLKWTTGGTGYIEAQNIRCEEVIGSTLIQDGAITTSKISAGSVDTNKLAANSVTAGKIAAGSIVAGDGVISNASIGSAQIINVTADKIDTRGLTIKDASGTVIFGSGTPLTEQYVNIAPGGANMIPNSGPFADQLGSYILANSSQPMGTTVAFAPSWVIYRPAGLGGVYVNGSGTWTTPNTATVNINTGSVEKKFTVQPNSRYEASIYLSAHRCDGFIEIAIYNSVGTVISYNYSNVISSNYVNGDVLLQDSNRAKILITMPSAAAYITYRVVLRGNGGIDPYLFMSLGYFGHALANQQTFSSWSDSGASFNGNITGQITPDTASTYIANATIGLAHINTASIGQLSALTATVGLLRSRATGGRVEIENDQQRVYNDSNILKVKIGYLG